MRYWVNAMADVQVFYQTVKAIPKGYYSSYGKIALLCGVHVRQVQAWLRTLPKDSELPWYRIINSQRKITNHAGAQRQHQLLASEGLIANAQGRFPVDRYWPTTNHEETR